MFHVPFIFSVKTQDVLFKTCVWGTVEFMCAYVYVVSTPVSRSVSLLLSACIIVSILFEVYYPDGTTAWRNPTASELTASLDSVKAVSSFRLLLCLQQSFSCILLVHPFSSPVKGDLHLSIQLL